MKLTKFDIADHLKSDAEIFEYLNIYLEEGDIKGLLRALGEVARAKGMAGIADTTGPGRQHLYETLSEKGNPTPDTLLKVLDAIGVRIRFAA